MLEMFRSLLQKCAGQLFLIKNRRKLSTSVVKNFAVEHTVFALCNGDWRGQKPRAYCIKFENETCVVFSMSVYRIQQGYFSCTFRKEMVWKVLHNRTCH